jgi:hypothetical protein
MGSVAAVLNRRAPGRPGNSEPAGRTAAAAPRNPAPAPSPTPPPTPPPPLPRPRGPGTGVVVKKTHRPCCAGRDKPPSVLEPRAMHNMQRPPSNRENARSVALGATRREPRAALRPAGPADLAARAEELALEGLLLQHPEREPRRSHHGLCGGRRLRDGRRLPPQLGVHGLQQPAVAGQQPHLGRRPLRYRGKCSQANRSAGNHAATCPCGRPPPVSASVPRESSWTASCRRGTDGCRRGTEGCRRGTDGGRRGTDG